MDAYIIYRGCDFSIFSNFREFADSGKDVFIVDDANKNIIKLANKLFREAWIYSDTDHAKWMMAKTLDEMSKKNLYGNCIYEKNTFYVMTTKREVKISDANIDIRDDFFVNGCFLFSN